MRFDHEFNDDEMNDEYHDHKGKGYASYNKPYSVTAWLEQTQVNETYVLMMDTDMFLRAPVDPIALGVRRGNVVSAEYTYLWGVESGMASRFIDKRLHKRMAQVGGFHIFHREDLRAISPRWLHFTRKVRSFANSDPDAFFNESFKESESTKPGESSVHHKQARWHTEMYGYVFAAAQVGVTHRIRRDVMLYPSYEPWLGRLPSIMHYGSDYTLGASYFNKMAHLDLKLETCPGFLFADPEIEHLGQLSKKDALVVEHLNVLNLAFCEFYATRANCTAKRMPSRCPNLGGGVSVLEQQLEQIKPSLKRCSDGHEGCKGWADGGECNRNPLFMHSSCPVSCGSCERPIDEIVPDDRWHGDWMHDGSSERLQQRDVVAQYLKTAEEEELIEVEELVAKRRENLAALLAADDAVVEEGDDNLHQEL